MSSITAPVWSWTTLTFAGVAAAVMALVAWPRLKDRLVALGRLLIVPAMAAPFALALLLERTFPPGRFASEVLPEFLRRGYWIWLVAFATGTLVAFAWSLWAVRSSAFRMASATAGHGRFPDLDAAWDEVQGRLEEAGIDIRGQHLSLVIAPDGDQVEALVRSAGPLLFAEAPEARTPIQAYATSDGLLLGCAGTSAFGAKEGGSTARLESLCRKLLALQPDRPAVRGVAVVFPADWAEQPDATEQAAAVREDLQTIRRILKVQCPVYALFTHMETVPGFTEFIGRMAVHVTPQVADKRLGFSVPRPEPFGGDLIKRGMTWVCGRLLDTTLDLLMADPAQTRSNAALMTLYYEFRRRRRRMGAILESAFRTPRGIEPVSFRGCYFLANGKDPREQAFAAGLLRGPRGRILADPGATTWTEDARGADRRDYRIASLIAGVGGSLALLGWISILRQTGLGWVGLLALVTAWVVAILRLRRSCA